jgi:hypothetical protein
MEVYPTNGDGESSPPWEHADHSLWTLATLPIGRRHEPGNPFESRRRFRRVTAPQYRGEAGVSDGVGPAPGPPRCVDRLWCKRPIGRIVVVGPRYIEDDAKQ